MIDRKRTDHATNCRVANLSFLWQLVGTILAARQLSNSCCRIDSPCSAQDSLRKRHHQMATRLW